MRWPAGECGAWRAQVARLARGLALLRMMVDAKSDTLVLIRGKLKAEAQALRAEVAALRGQAHDTSTELRDKEHGAQQERGQLRAEMHALQVRRPGGCLSVPACLTGIGGSQGWCRF